MSINLFVYGTLKTGCCRHRFLADQAFLGKAITLPRYRMFDLGEYPGLIRVNQGDFVSGELFCVDVDTMKRLDAVEGVSAGLYRRESIDLQSPWHETSTISYFYRLQTQGFPILLNWSCPS